VRFDDLPEFFARSTRFAQSIRGARQRLGRSQHEMALQSGVTGEQWLQLERGRYRPPDEVVIRLAQELGLDERELLFEAALQDFSGE
jgi:transcriptional regulator with XRE-family HTH domain